MQLRAHPAPQAQSGSRQTCRVRPAPTAPTAQALTCRALFVLLAHMPMLQAPRRALCALLATTLQPLVPLNASLVTVGSIARIT